MSIYIGCHLSVTDGYEAMGKTMVDFGGNTFAFFTRNPRGGKSKELQPDDVSALLSLLERERFGPLVAHGSYTMNLCSAKEETRAHRPGDGGGNSAHCRCAESADDAADADYGAAAF